MENKKYGTFEDLLLITAQELQPIVIRLKKIILEIDPSTFEVVRLGEKAASYGLGPKKMTEAYVYIMPHKKWVNLGFYKGALLNDEDKLLEGTGKKLRHIKMHSLEDANRLAVKAMIQLAYEERQKALGRE